MVKQDGCRIQFLLPSHLRDAACSVFSGIIVVTTLDCGPRGSWFESRVGANIL